MYKHSIAKKLLTLFLLLALTLGAVIISFSYGVSDDKSNFYPTLEYRHTTTTTYPDGAVPIADGGADNRNNGGGIYNGGVDSGNNGGGINNSGADNGNNGGSINNSGGVEYKTAVE